MNEFNYARSLQTAKRLIDKFGRIATLVVISETPDPLSPFNPGTRTETTLDTKMVFLNYKLKDIDGTLVKTGDQKVLLAASTLEPVVDGKIRRGTEVWHIRQVAPLNPGGTKILYTLQVRR